MLNLLKIDLTELGSAWFNQQQMKQVAINETNQRLAAEYVKIWQLRLPDYKPSLTELINSAITYHLTEAIKNQKKSK